MYAFQLERPTSTAEAARLAAAGARPLAGGQTLLASMKLRLVSAEQVVDLSAIGELAGIRRDGNAVVIGAMTRHAEVAGSAEVKAAIPALADLAGGIGDRQVRNLGTLGGSLANNDPSACYPAAVLGLGATVNTTKRSIPADQFFTGLFSTALEEGELITSVSFPIPRRAAYCKFRQPASRFALIGVFVAQTDAGVRVAVTGGGNGVFRHQGLEQALSANFTPQAAAGVSISADDLSSDIHASAAYRANLISVMTQRAVAKALG
ncbi:xanthine dehydrogenase family protein subunit M [Caldimonas thermodepolymerans]|jgi:Aerobic-type carbon monoxide dehydrogenase, middle subunit CoxM/CutM homologs|uniref:Carbon monoxide dehydrogenase n=1 Tax=Caldimonas thermodepolymerans TaxID=215580 RepID=A0A2S5T0U9_9BURK|nr:xanthine dehydrogenase family protein subunit M [Caldimonas thermodepolymerans]PPE68603.1 carbon monoxide dehydrogenase [Caldimonas thermodepolymerans]QPC31995.1 xanthine dehydrogenase family protein subunit M [Caldimonas thermodepolymerans]RDI01479.1 carbon-monoxide dehydrogenase medium subunit [Caldimonas thermodepolymerans]TCP08367.1 carbon-monoxide dehydrogenase medium subunit [Caldimonas thermodepolymerans]UZG48521.1 xanthine dehydrogenase family protein subunit M [Caldimonas thermodep